MWMVSKPGILSLICLFRSLQSPINLLSKLTLKPRPDLVIPTEIPKIPLQALQYQLLVLLPSIEPQSLGRMSH